LNGFNDFNVFNDLNDFNVFNDLNDFNASFFVCNAFFYGVLIFH